MLQFGTACVQLQFPTLSEENISGHVVLECACTDKARKGSKKISDDYTELLLLLGVFFPTTAFNMGGRQGPGSVWLVLDVFIILHDSTSGL